MGKQRAVCRTTCKKDEQIISFNHVTRTKLSSPGHRVREDVDQKIDYPSIIVCVVTMLTNLHLSKELRAAVIDKGLHIAAGVVVLIIGHQVATMVKTAIYAKGLVGLPANTRATGEQQRKQIHKTKILFIIIGQIAYYAIMGFATLTVLKLLGIEATSLIALLGATGFTVGLALQGTLSDISSGVLLGVFQTYTIGDLIEVNGVKGRVKDFNLTRTILTDMDTNSLITVPNRVISESTITNYTKSEHCKVNFAINVSNKYEDFEQLITRLKAEIAKFPGVLDTPDPPVVGVSDMGNVGTMITTKFTINCSNFPAIVLPIQTRIRQFLTDQKVPLVDPF